MADDVEQQVSHMISPSSWNRFETCPRMYWLSRQRLPRKAGMAASVGTAVHASVEDLLQEDYSHIGNTEDGWLPKEGERLLKIRWEEEKEIFTKLCQNRITAKKWAELAQTQSENLKHGLAVNLDPSSLILDTFFRIEDCARTVR